MVTNRFDVFLIVLNPFRSERLVSPFTTEQVELSGEPLQPGAHLFHHASPQCGRAEHLHVRLPGQHEPDKLFPSAGLHPEVQAAVPALEHLLRRVPHAPGNIRGHSRRKAKMNVHEGLATHDSEPLVKCPPHLPGRRFGELLARPAKR